MTNAEKVRLQTWWLEELRVITRKVMKAEDKRVERLKKKHEKELGDLAIESTRDIDDLYAYGAISEKKRDRLYGIFEGLQAGGDAFYRAQIDLLQELYQDAKNAISDLQKEDKQ